MIPAEYYEATALVVNITAPCSVDKVEICRQYVYPNISSFDQTKASGGYINTGGSRSNIQLYLEESEVSCYGFFNNLRYATHTHTRILAQEWRDSYN